MSLIPSRHCTMLVLGMTLFFVGIPDRLHAQRDDIVIGGPAPEALPDADVIRLQVLQRRGMIGGLQLPTSAIDQWVFGGNTEALATSQLESLLEERIDAFVTDAPANEEQKRKLELAGRVDIQRFLERVEDLRRQDARGNIDRISAQQKGQRLNALLKMGLFTSDSFFAKTARGLFTAEQLERVERGRTAHQHRAHLQRATALLKDAIKLTNEQEQALIALLLRETRPPGRPGEHAYHVVLFDMKRLPETRLKPLLDEQQWELFNRQFEQIKWMEPQLKLQGYLP